MSEILKLIGDLTPEKRALLEQLMQDEGIDVSELPIMPRTKGAEKLPLSSTQERMWFLHQLQPGNFSDNMPVGFYVRGNFQTKVMERVLNAIIDRHQIFRTTFGSVNGKSIQRVNQAPELTIEEVSLEWLPEGEQDAEVQRLATQFAQYPFDLKTGPLLVAKVLKLAPQSFVFLMTLHHIVSDGWSLAVMYDEMSQLYGAFEAGQPNPLTALPIQYADFALWQKDWMAGNEMATQLEYWKNQLSGKLPVLDLPTDKPRPAVQSFQGAKHFIHIPADLYADFKAISTNDGGTLFMGLLAAWQVLLHRYAGQDDIIVGAPIANRVRPEIERLIGPFLNMLALRTDLSGNPTFRDLFGRVRDMTFDAYANQVVPFDRLVETLRPERDLSRTPVFQVMLQVAQKNMLYLPNLETQTLEFDSGTSQFDIALHLWEGADGLNGRIEYNTALFAADTIERMAGHLQQLMRSIVADPNQTIDSLGMLESAEIDALDSWNQTHTEYPASTYHALFEAQAAATPERIAIHMNGRDLTYGELNAKANQVAHILRERGVKPNDLVGLGVERSFEMVIGLLGVLKAGGAYVPLDPKFPPERLSYMLEDAGVAALLTQWHLVDLFGQPEDKVIYLDRWETIGDYPIDNPAIVTESEDLAYVIYTSGSTGKPKGVQLTHRSLVNFLVSMQAEPGMTADDVIVPVTTLSFDIAMLELLLPLQLGAKMVLVSAETAGDGAALANTILANNATMMQATPTTWRLMLDAGWRNSTQIKMLCGGEALPAELAQRLTATGAQLWNMYGPTETTIWSAVKQINAEDAKPLIGGPIANTQLYVLDGAMQRVPVGVPGELHIGGHGLAKGYANRPSLTAERFVNNPFGAGKLYKTGDLVRFLADGSIEFMGRLDHQVKLRGFRIELGDIEAHLVQHDGIDAAVALVREDVPGDKRLVAYLIAPSQPNISGIRAHLKQSLPEYMIPSTFVFMDGFPLTPNNKVDRRALPAPSQARPELSANFMEPTTPTQIKLAEIWQSVLDIEKAGVLDNFFELGGHSLLVTQVISRIRADLGVELPLRVVFDAPTISELAEKVDSAEPAQAAAPMPKLVKRARRGRRMTRTSGGKLVGS